MSEAPEHFQRAINLFDPLLSVRKGRALTNKWVIERKAYLGKDELMYLRKRRDRAFRIAAQKQVSKPTEYQKTLDLAKQIAEETDCAERGYRVILFADQLDNRIFDMLAMGDTRRYGGFSRWLAEFEAEEARHEKDEKRQQSNENVARGKQVFDDLNYIWTDKETQLLAGERSMKRLLQ